MMFLLIITNKDNTYFTKGAEAYYNRINSIKYAWSLI